MKAVSINRRAHPPGATFSTWSAKDGWPIRVMDWPQVRQADARGSLLFAGGRGDFIEKYLEPLGHWHACGWNVTSFDWRSQGASRGNIENGHLDSLAPLVEDAAELLADWMARTAAPHVAVGHSMGGHLLLRTLAEASPALAAAVLVAPMIGINSMPVPSWASHALAQAFCGLGWNKLPVWNQSARLPPPGSARHSFLTSCSERYADELWWLERQPGFALGAPSWGWLNAAYTSIAGLTPQSLAGVDVPVLLIGAQRDRLVSAAAIRAAAAALPKAELVMFREAGHELLRESDPVRTQAIERIDLFLETHARG
jgi:lysophospholipase